MNHLETQQTALDFFFNMIKWVFNEFLIKVTVLGIPVLWFFIALTVVVVVMSGVVNITYSKISGDISNSKRRKRQAARAKAKAAKKGK